MSGGATHIPPHRQRAAATLEDVSRRAGISKYTVSAVLNGTRSNTRVSPETRERILRAVKELGYQPNAIARSLRRRHQPDRSL